MTKVENIDLFFQDPAIEQSTQGKFGVLYLLRRDINQCIARQILWPATMAILAGADLLGKFYAGKDDSYEVGLRFRKFIDKYFQPMSSDDAKAIYQLRNALMHSFGLYSKGYKFVIIAEGNQPLVQKRANDNYLVDVLTLHKRFESAVAIYQDDLENNQDLQDNFSAMFPRYGSIHIGKPDIIAEWLTSTGHGQVSILDGS